MHVRVVQVCVIAVTYVGSDCLLQHRATSDCENNYNDVTASTALSEERAKTSS